MTFLKFWRRPIAHYTLFFLIIVSLIFGPLLLTQTSLIWNGDGITQHYPALLHWQQDLKQLLFHHQWPAMWQWQIGLGQDYFQTFSYYVMGDIFTYPIVFFKASQAAHYYDIMLIVRLYLAGLSFLIAAPHLLPNKQHMPNWILSLAAITYVFTGYTAFSAFEHPFFINPLIIFPLLIWSLLRVLQSGHWLFLLVMVTWTLWNNFYFAFILGLSSFIFWFGYHLLHRQWTQYLVRIIGTTILSCLIAAPLLIPSILATFSAARANTKLANGLILYPTSYYLNLPGSLIGTPTTPNFWVTGGISFLSITAIVFGWRRFETFRTYNYIWITATIGLMLPIFAAIFNGGSSPSNRWMFVLSLPMALMTINLLVQLKTLTNRDIMLTAIVGLVATISLFIANHFDVNSSFGLLIAIFWAGLCLLLLIIQTDIKHQPLLIVTLTLLSLVMLMTRNHSDDSNPKKSVLMPMRTVQKLTRMQADYSVTPNQFERVQIDNQLSNLTGVSPASNLPIIGPVNSINSYWSLQNANTSYLMQTVQNQTTTPNDVTGTLDDRNVLSNILGVTNRYENDDQSMHPASYQSQINHTINQQTVATSRNVYPLIYAPITIVSTKNFQQLNATQREATLADSIILNQTKSHATSDFSRQVITTNISVNGTKQWQKEVNFQYQTHASVLPDGITIQANSKLRGTELHLELSHLTYQPFTLRQRYLNDLSTYQFNFKQQQQNPQHTADLRYNPTSFSYNWFKNNITSPEKKVNGYQIETSYSGHDNSLYQPGKNNLSFYQQRSAVTVNLGTAKKVNQNHFVPLMFSQPGTYRFKIKVVAIPVDLRFNQVAQQIQTQAPKKINIKRDQVTTVTDQNPTGYLATTIPYSSGWQSTTNQLVKSGTGMLAIRLHAGQNQIQLRYQTPGLKLGILLALAGWLIIIGISIWLIIYKIKISAH
ncbi:YfhO family protein [Weissella diestrammenae]|uniref:YfhO family protein n=1 Tax=Weissella diestrammenae TaxID=1162633 RepID=A0A7G9T439_9LACO|nr:YfhO family protein [Weissella diestrammenae]MCM0583385.1 YfhO family protein [Weissella diestrammenae]QNN74864.1 YfhO family protein [Weissella diestrammenae]